MTNEERDRAIRELQNSINVGLCPDIESRKVAIKALSQQTEDAISRQAAVNIASGFCHPANIADELARLPSVNAEPMRWIPITYRPMTDEEKKDYAERTGFDEEDLDTMLNCKLPEDGETVLITDCLGNVEVDTFIYDCEGCYFECNCEMEDVKAWMPLPKAYEPQESEVSDADSD